MIAHIGHSMLDAYIVDSPNGLYSFSVYVCVLVWAWVSVCLCIFANFLECFHISHGSLLIIRWRVGFATQEKKNKKKTEKLEQKLNCLSVDECMDISLNFGVRISKMKNKKKMISHWKTWIHCKLLYEVRRLHISQSVDFDLPMSLQTPLQNYNLLFHFFLSSPFLRIFTHSQSDNCIQFEHRNVKIVWTKKKNSRNARKHHKTF